MHAAFMADKIWGDELEPARCTVVLIVVVVVVVVVFVVLLSHLRLGVKQYLELDWGTFYIIIG